MTAPASSSPLAGGIVSHLTSNAIQAVARAVYGAAQQLLKSIFRNISGATRITPQAVWYSGGHHSPVGIVAGIAGVVLVLLFLLQIARSLIHQEGAGLARAVTGTFKAVYGTATFLAFLTIALVVTNDLCHYAIHQAGGTIGSVAGSLMGVSVLGSMVAADPGLVIFLGLIIMVGALVLYATLLIRAVAVYGVAMAGPVVMAGQVYDSTRSWLRRWIEVILALVTSKLAIVLLFVLGMAMVRGTQGYTGAIAGTLIVLAASFSPFVVYKLFHAVGVEAGALLHEGFRRSPANAGAWASMDWPTKLQSLLPSEAGMAAPAAAGLGGGGGGGSSGGNSAGGGGQSAPGSGGDLPGPPDPGGSGGDGAGPGASGGTPTAPGSPVPGPSSKPSSPDHGGRVVPNQPEPPVPPDAKPVPNEAPPPGPQRGSPGPAGPGPARRTGRPMPPPGRHTGADQKRGER